MCSNLTLKSPERRRFGVFVVNFDIYSIVFIVDFEQVNLLEMVILKMLLYCLILKFIPVI